MKERLRICCISYMFLPVIGGAENRAAKQARQLQALGHDVLIITLRLQRNWPRTEQLAGLPVIRVGGLYRRNGQLRLGKLGHLCIEIGILRLLWRVRQRYDIIHAFQLTPPSVVAALLGHIMHTPVVVSIQNAGPAENQLTRSSALEDGGAHGLQGALKEDWAIRGSDVTGLPHVMLGSRIFLHLLRRSRAYYQALSTRCHSHLLARGFRAERIITIPGSVDTEKFRASPDLLRKERTIICVARLEYAKGIDMLLCAWAQMMQTSSAWRLALKPELHLVGDGKFRGQLERMTTELGIEDSVKFLGQRGDIITLLQGSWGFVLPSRWEGMPNALLEAMACGLPCIATCVSGSEDVIINGLNGFLVQPEQPAELALALRRIIESPDVAQRLGSAARTTVVRDYQLSTVVARCVALYHRLLADNGASPSETRELHEASLQNSMSMEEKSGK
ncbi:MAG: glycosyltransferase [Chloroflexota bacterium]|nr:glycosyltransferase [Chloroflexota bacterium]